MIRDTIRTALVTAMKAGEKSDVAAIRLIQAAVKNRDIEERTKAQPTDDDTLVVEVLQKMVKQRRESRSRSTARARARNSPPPRRRRSR